MDDLLAAMLARRIDRLEDKTEDKAPTAESDITDVNPPFDSLTENVAYHWRRYEDKTQAVKKPALVPERLVLAACIRWLKRVPYLSVKRVSVGAMRTAQGFTMNFGGKKGESDLVLTPDAGQPFERQIHAECKRPDVIVDGRKVQRAGVQSEDQKKYQAEKEARGDKYVVVTSVIELRDFLVSLGFEHLPKVGR
jgi:hypothetical protein